MKRFFAALCIALFWPLAASATITVTSQGHATANGNSTVVVNLNPASAIAAGDLVCVFTGNSLIGTDNVAVSDSKSNAYTLITSNSTVLNVEIYCSVVTTGLATTDTITVTESATGFSQTVAGTVLSAHTTTGAWSRDTAVGQAGTATSTTPSITSQAPSGSGTELFIAPMAVSNTPTFTEAASWTNSMAQDTSTGDIIRGATIQGTAAQTYNPSLSTSELWWGYVFAYQTAVGSGKTCTLSLIGAGPC
jgi:hypothetical protein